jgi:LAS superfamily LD-carboxypeptidase LdcB
MPYNQRNQAGRGPKQKTGAGIPSALLQNEQSPAKQKMVSSENMTVAEKKKMKDNSVFGPDGKNVALPPYEKKKLVKGSNKKDEKKPKPAPSPAKQNGMKYDIKEASNQKLSAKARKNYAENAQHDSKKGYR